MAWAGYVSTHRDFVVEEVAVAVHTASLARPRSRLSRVTSVVAELVIRDALVNVGFVGAVDRLFLGRCST
jgi:hypothetical protein